MGRGPPNDRFAALDSWRGICALWVALYHFRIVSHVYEWDWVRRGDAGVDFFFVLSGFVLAHAYGDRLADAGSRLSFLIRRIGRLYPLHLATLGAVVGLEIGRWALGVGGQAFTGDTRPDALLWNLLLMHGWGIFENFTWNIPSWSISVEWALCLIFAGISTLPRPLLWAALMAVGGFAVQVWFATLPAYPTEGYSAMARGVYAFFLGVLIYRAFRQGVRLPAWTEWLALPLLAAAVWSQAEDLHALTPIIFGVLVVIFAAERGWTSRLLNQPWLRWIGEISYSIYMVHFVLILAIFGLAAATGSATGQVTIIHDGKGLMLAAPNKWFGDLAAPSFLGLVLVAASITYRWIETPGRDFFNGLSRRFSQPGSPSVAQPPGPTA